MFKQKFIDFLKKLWCSTQSWALFGILIGWFISYSYYTPPTKAINPENKSFFIGSGTVISFLTKNLGEKWKENSYILSGASQIATDLFLSSRDKTFPIIAMSSTKLEVKQLPPKIKDQSKDRIFEIELARDTLTVAFYFPEKDDESKIELFEKNPLRTSIKIEQLKAFLRNPKEKFDLYLTTTKSGTRKEFEKILKNPHDSIFDWSSLNKNIEILDQKKYQGIKKRKKIAVLLCSRNYFLDTEHINDFKILEIEKQEGGGVGDLGRVTRGLYLYFSYDNVIGNKDETIFSIKGSKGDNLNEIARNIFKIEDKQKVKWCRKQEDNDSKIIELYVKKE